MFWWIIYYFSCTNIPQCCLCSWQSATCSHICFLLRDPNSCFLLRSHLHSRLWLKWGLCRLKDFFFFPWGISSMYWALYVCWLYVQNLLYHVYLPLILYSFSLLCFSVGLMHNLWKEKTDVIAAQSRLAINKSLILNRLSFHSSYSVCILACGKDLLFG